MDILPMFPLNIVVFPGESINLHIFELKYRQLIHEASATNISFGIPFVNSSNIEVYAPELILDKIVHEYPDGKMDITVKSIGLLKLHKFYNQHPDKLYPAAEIERINIDLKPDLRLNAMIIPLLDKMYKLLKVENVKVNDIEDFRTDQLSHKVGYTLKQEYEVLTLRSESERAQFMYNHLLQFLPHIIITEELKSKAALNGHFQHHDPPKF